MYEMKDTADPLVFDFPEGLYSLEKVSASSELRACFSFTRVVSWVRT